VEFENNASMMKRQSCAVYLLRMSLERWHSHPPWTKKSYNLHSTPIIHACTNSFHHRNTPAEVRMIFRHMTHRSINQATYSALSHFGIAIAAHFSNLEKEKKRSDRRIFLGSIIYHHYYHRNHAQKATHTHTHTHTRRCVIRIVQWT
jgi:hypothetical protein